MNQRKDRASVIKEILRGIIVIFFVHPLDEMEIAKIRYKHMEIYF